jgi:transcriptional regulator with XRE-family HTH domain
MTKLQELVAGNLRRLRLNRGLSRQELAWRAGIEGRFVAFLEEGTYAATTTMLDKLAHALGVDSSALLVNGEHGAYPRAESGRRPLDIAIGRRLRAIRRERGLSRATLARELGVSARRLQKHERGAKRMRPELLQRVAAILTVRISVFFADDRGGEPACSCRYRRDLDR